MREVNLYVEPSLGVVTISSAPNRYPFIRIKGIPADMIETVPDAAGTIVLVERCVLDNRAGSRVPFIQRWGADCWLYSNSEVIVQ